MVRNTGDTLALTPPLIISEEQIGETVDKMGKLIRGRLRRRTVGVRSRHLCCGCVAVRSSHNPRHGTDGTRQAISPGSSTRAEARLGSMPRMVAPPERGVTPTARRSR